MHVRPAMPYSPTSHFEHEVLPSEVLPSTVVVSPSLHRRHLVAGSVLLRANPVSHGWHLPPTTLLYVPASQGIHFTLPSCDPSPALHGSHVVEFDWVLFVLAAHGMHEVRIVSF